MLTRKFFAPTLALALVLVTVQARQPEDGELKSAEELSASLSALANQLMSPSAVRAAQESFRYLPEKCLADDKYTRLLETRFLLFSAIHAPDDRNVFEFLKNRNIRFWALNFFENHASIDLQITSYPRRDDWHLFATELLAYHDKIVNTDGWQDKFNELANDASLRRYLARPQTYHDRGFPKPDNDCYLLKDTFLDDKAGWDKGTEGWFYSFWLRRYMEGNLELTRIMLEWASQILSNTDYVESEQASQYREHFYANLTTTEQPDSGSEPENEHEPVATAAKPDAGDCLRQPGPRDPLFGSVSESRGGNLRFRSFFDIDWKSKAPTEVRNINVNNLDFDQFTRLQNLVNMWGNAEIIYEAPLDCTLFIGSYFMISDVGVHPVRLLHLEGTARFAANDSRSGFSRSSYFGRINFESLAPESHAGGFVMLTGSELEPLPQLDRSPDFSLETRERRVTYTYRLRNDEYKLELDLEHAPKIATIYQFELDNVHYIYVRWGIDSSFGGSCGFNASLFRAKYSDREKKLEKLKWSRYGCDI